VQVDDHTRRHADARTERLLGFAALREERLVRGIGAARWVLQVLGGRDSEDLGEKADPLVLGAKR
jgi:hypothetical protein